MLPVTLALLAIGATPAVVSEEEFRPFTEPPRLFLRAQRLRLLKRERERQSLRWQQFAAIAAGAGTLPEPGLTRALYFSVAGDEAAGRAAIEWALKPEADIRQIAIVTDWCDKLLTPEERAALLGRLRTVAARAPDSIAAARDRAFAAIVLSSESGSESERSLRRLVTGWWRTDFLPQVRSGRLILAPHELAPLYEFLHAIADNLKIDLREDAGDWFRFLPRYHVLAHYPAPYQASENEYFIPLYAGGGPPDLRRAALSRIAGLSMVAFDTNSQETQFLQGWLMLDRFALRTPFGAPYEFLWANPYLPGLSYHHMPSFFHDAASGRMALRSSWEDDSEWLGFVGRELQYFADGKAGPLPRDLSRMGSVRVIRGEPGPAALRLDKMEEPLTGILCVGLPPGSRFEVHTGADGPAEYTADRNGTLSVHLQPGTPAVRFHRVKR